MQPSPTPNIRWFIVVVLSVLAILAVIWFGSERTGGGAASLLHGASLVQHSAAGQSTAQC